jgi:hypothetical protein
VGAYLARLAMVSRALNLAHAAYATALEERDELSGRLEAYAVKATRVSTGSAAGTAAHAGTASPTTGFAAGATDTASRTAKPDADDDLGELFRRAQNVLRAQPTDMARARALVAAHQAYLASRSASEGTT